MGRRNHPDPFVPPPIDPAEQRTADREVGVIRIPYGQATWMGRPVSVTIGDTERAERIAAKRTTESN